MVFTFQDMASRVIFHLVQVSPKMAPTTLARIAQYPINSLIGQYAQAYYLHEKLVAR